ncbi:MAG TPA: hypothetical protein VN616_09590 [Puia sp.]|nr:hypothetical protein [Puia sp.]
MIEFKRGVEIILPYDRKNYLGYQADTDFSVKWYGVSFQVVDIADQKDANFEQYLEMYEPLFKNIVLYFDKFSSWIVSHDADDVPWFPNDHNNLSDLRTLFKRNKVADTFSGAIAFSTSDLIAYSRELISYPYIVTGRKGVLYRDLDISHSELPSIIRISGHLNIDFVSTDREYFEKIRHADFASGFEAKEYRGN